MCLKREGKTFEINEDYTIPETLFPALIKQRDDKMQSFHRFNAFVFAFSRVCKWSQGRYFAQGTLFMSFGSGLPLAPQLLSEP